MKLRKEGFRYYTPDEFKNTFSVGDLIWGPVRVVGRISAIGKKRFLFYTTGWAGSINERVGTQDKIDGWKRISNPDDPELKEYGLALGLRIDTVDDFQIERFERK